MRILFIAAISTVFMIASSQICLASIGLAEWTVYTPGGNIICHSDGWKETYRDCLRADDSDRSLSLEQRQKVYVPHLRRWRYYRDYVIGENDQGVFAFNEINKAVQYFKNENELLKAVQQNRLGRAKSDWLTASDGWTEARFPQFVWKHVRPLLRVTPWMRLNLNGLNRLACPRKSAQRCCLQNEWICIARQHGESSVSNLGRD
jgi:hypothetical protein